ncbi:MAG: hypothetical protein JWM93_904 [Frankiales bacterium]|nr:hypothetical protein [Frankiales bacterium]
MRLLFWFLLLAMPLAAVLFVGWICLGLWRRGVGAFREVGDLGDRVGDVFGDERETLGGRDRDDLRAAARPVKASRR